MEKGVILASTTKKGAVAGTIKLENGKTMPINVSWFKLTLDMNDKEINVRRVKGQITEIEYEGNKYDSSCLMGKEVSTKPGKGDQKSNKHNSFKQNQNNNRRQDNNKGNKPSEDREPSQAPYNFIELNDKVVPAEFASPQKLKEFIQTGEGRLSGSINLEMETKTPLYIRGGLEREEFIECKDETKCNKPDFFSPGGKIKIPGSSLRGMIRNLVEIMSYSKIQFIDDKLLYYRGLADKSTLRNEYQRNMSSFDRTNNRTTHQFNAGYLTKKGLDYFIIPAQKINGKQFKQIRKGENPEFSYKYNSDGSCLVVSGKMNNKKHDWVIFAPDRTSSVIEIPEEDIIHYENDSNRFYDKSKDDDKQKKDGNLLRMLKVSEDGKVPCFYVCWIDDQRRERVSFGHTGYFRLAYRYTIKQHLMQSINDNSITDLTEAIFGKESQFASRVFFEDAELNLGQGDVLMGKMSPKILASPKPTTFQHYLKQPQGVNTPLKELVHWNSKDAQIRGSKMYWHRNINRSRNTWIEQNDNIKDSDTQHTTINPVKEGVKFSGRIRFENLSPVELGTLLFALDLPEEHYHKLGMGKPLGMGSLQIKPTLIIKDKKKRYSSLFNDNAWTVGEERTEGQEYKRAFERHVLEAIGNNTLNNLWDEPRMKQLKKMMDWKKTTQSKWLEHTEYLGLTQFKNRNVLPAPDKF